MATVYEVPTAPYPQNYAITLGSTEYRLSFAYHDTPGGGWLLSIAQSDGTPMVGGIPMNTGRDLLEQYAHLGFTGTLTVSTDADPDAVPTFDNLGSASHLYWTAG